MSVDKHIEGLARALYEADGFIADDKLHTTVLAWETYVRDAVAAMEYFREHWQDMDLPEKDYRMTDKTREAFEGWADNQGWAKDASRRQMFVAYEAGMESVKADKLADALEACLNGGAFKHPQITRQGREALEAYRRRVSENDKCR